MGSFFGFICKFFIPTLIKLASFILYYISAFENAISSMSGLYEENNLKELPLYHNLELDQSCSDDYDTGFISGGKGDFVFALFIFSFIFNVIVLLSNIIGYYKFYSSKEECPKYFGNGAIFSIISVIFWVPGNYSSRIYDGYECSIVEGIMVHFINVHGLNFVIASWTLTLFTIIFIFIAGLFEYKFENIPTFISAIYIGLIIYSFLYFILSIIMILWCTWVFQMPFIIIFVLEMIIGFVVFVIWVEKDHKKVEEVRVIFIIVRVFIILK